MTDEELLEFKKKDITDEVIMNLEASLHLNMKIVADEDKKQEFKEYQMAVYFLREQRDNLQQELQRKDNIINKIKEELNNPSNFEIYYQRESVQTLMEMGAKYYREYLLDKIKELEND